MNIKSKEEGCKIIESIIGNQNIFLNPNIVMTEPLNEHNWYLWKEICSVNTHSHRHTHTHTHTHLHKYVLGIIKTLQHASTVSWVCYINSNARGRDRSMSSIWNDFIPEKVALKNNLLSVAVFAVVKTVIHNFHDLRRIWMKRLKVVWASLPVLWALKTVEQKKPLTSFDQPRPYN